MTTFWKCSVCLEEIAEPTAVCHHCGRILCDKVNECRFLISDNAFAGSSPARAAHCPDCQEKYHSGVKSS